MSALVFRVAELGFGLEFVVFAGATSFAHTGTRCRGQWVVRVGMSLIGLVCVGFVWKGETVPASAESSERGAGGVAEACWSKAWHEFGHGL